MSDREIVGTLVSNVAQARGHLAILKEYLADLNNGKYDVEVVEIMDPTTLQHVLRSKKRVISEIEWQVTVLEGALTPENESVSLTDAQVWERQKQTINENAP